MIAERNIPPASTADSVEPNLGLESALRLKQARRERRRRVVTPGPATFGRGRAPSLRNIKYTKMCNIKKKFLISPAGSRENVSPGSAVALDVPEPKCPHCAGQRGNADL